MGLGSLSSRRGGEGEVDGPAAISDDDDNDNDDGGDSGPPLAKPPAAFCHFRFNLDDDESMNPLEVLYVYEIQVSDRYRRRGLGRRLMGLMEDVARRTGMKRLMLTVFKSNVGAMDFYLNKMKYEIDRMSPSRYGEEEADYEILSKAVVV